ncbi:MAG: N(4)-(beta-N-acetylglucosaminyl)-L-asparaginase [Phycisphaerae bacterium]
MNQLSRRDFLGGGAAAIGAGGVLAAAAASEVVAGAASSAAPASARRARSKRTGGTRSDAPVIIASANGLRATDKAMAMVTSGADTLDAVIAGVNIIEEDPNDHSVGYGGLPNEDGVVELDSCVMHGPTHRAGAVAALRNIKTPSRVARLVMQRTDHVLLVGEGALRFARAHGVDEVDLLTDDARKIWLRWKETHSDRDDWIPIERATGDGAQADATRDVPYTYGTINCCARNANGDLSGVTTTSGLSYKIPGRVGDSPIIGAGLYVDNDVGAAGSTGRGEAVIQICGAHTVVEAMRHGKSPTDACLYALQRIADKTSERRLLREDGRPGFDVKFYAVHKDGRYGAAAMWSGAKYAVFADGRNRHEPCAHLFERT